MENDLLLSTESDFKVGDFSINQFFLITPES